VIAIQSAIPSYSGRALTYRPLCLKSRAMADELLDPERQQYSRPVEALPQFNGGTCLVTIDVMGVGTAVGFDWVTKHRLNASLPPPTDADIADAIVAQIAVEAAKCPAGSIVKLQLMYHCDPKRVWGLDAAGKVAERQWRLQDSVLAALRKLAQRGRPAIAKVYLCGCYSDNDRDLVAAAFAIPGVTHVITVNDIIELAPGSIAGAVYPTFQPHEVLVTVWIKEGGKQIRLTPGHPVSKDDKFDIPTNTVKDRKCPTTETLTDSTRFTVGYWNTAALAIAGGNALLPTTATQEATKAFRSYQCPCATCSTKQMGAVSFAGSTVTPSLSWLASAIFWKKSYKATVVCRWSVPVTCT
jgi:hypothetical protein